MWINSAVLPGLSLTLRVAELCSHVGCAPLTSPGLFSIPKAGPQCTCTLWSYQFKKNGTTLYCTKYMLGSELVRIGLKNKSQLTSVFPHSLRLLQFRTRLEDWKLRWCWTVFLSLFHYVHWKPEVQLPGLIGICVDGLEQYACTTPTLPNPWIPLLPFIMDTKILSAFSFFLTFSCTTRVMFVIFLCSHNQRKLMKGILYCVALKGTTYL